MPLLDVIVPCELKPQGWAYVQSNAPGGDFCFHAVECSAVPMSTIQFTHQNLKRLKQTFGNDAITKNNITGDATAVAAQRRLESFFALSEYWRSGKQANLKDAVNFDLMADAYPNYGNADKDDIAAAIGKEKDFWREMLFAKLRGPLQSGLKQATQLVLWQKPKGVPLPAIFAPDVATGLRVLMLLASKLPKGPAKCRGCNEPFIRRKPQHFYCDKKVCRNLAHAIVMRRSRTRSKKEKVSA